MAHIVIVGAGVGGMPTAYELREALADEHRITVINRNGYFQFVPSNPWVAVGWRKREEITVELAPVLAKHNIGFIESALASLSPEENQLTLENGDTLDYDYLVLATGPRLAFEEVPGAGPTGQTLSVCSVEHAEQAWEKYQTFLDTPGPVIIGAMPGASCFGPAYEFAFIVNADLKKRKLRHKVPITFVTSEPYIGHLGLGGVGDSKSMLESELRNNDIKWIANAKTTAVDNGTMYVTELNDKGEVHKSHELPFSFSMMLPAFKGIDPIASVPGLCNPRGFVLIDAHQRSVKYANIFAAGVCVAIPPVETTPVPTGAPKTGYMIETMVTAIVKNITAEMEGAEAKYKGSWNAICLADMGTTGAAFVALPQMPPRNVNWFKKGKWVHMAKIAFERYFLYKMRHGTSEPIYEKYVLKLLGIERLDH